MEKFADKL